jgi:phosphoglycolate phosphatase
LKSQGKRTFLITNNSHIFRENYAEKCQKNGFNFDREDVLTSSYVAAHYLKQMNFKQKAYVIGTETTEKELEFVGIEAFGSGPDILQPNLSEYMTKHYKLEENVGAVIVGNDPHFSIPKLVKAINYLKHPNVLFFVTNSDDFVKLPGLVFPDAGAVVASIERASERQASVIGKPSAYSFSVISNALAIDKDRSLMIGDCMNTDILFGKNAGIKTLLVGTGLHKMADVDETMRKLSSGDESVKNWIPDFYVDSLGDIFVKLSE